MMAESEYSGDKPSQTSEEVQRGVILTQTDIRMSKTPPKKYSFWLDVKLASPEQP